MRKILKGNLDCIGCPNYHVTKNGKVYSNYKDNIRTHNHYKNLYWGTAKENTQQCIREGRFKFSDTKLSRPDILQLLYEYDTGMIKAKLARKYEISPMLVYKYIKKRKRYEKDFERTHDMAS